MGIDRMLKAPSPHDALHKKHRRPAAPEISHGPVFPNPSTISRKASCACGGGCHSCQANSSGLKVSAPNDAAEVEADRIADSVMGQKAPRNIHTAQTTSAGSIYAKSEGGGSPVHSSTADRINSARSGGHGLDTGTRSFMEGRFGREFSDVRVHTGSEAAALSRDLGASAFTLGSDIYFGAGKYRPDTDTGKRLLAHELTHVVQGGSSIHRCADEDAGADYDAIIKDIKALKAYTDLDEYSKSVTELIVTEAKAKSDCLYYAKNLKLLFETPMKALDLTASDNRKKTDKALEIEEARLGTGKGQEQVGAEEAATADPVAAGTSGPGTAAPAQTRNWTEIAGVSGGGIYYVDKTDLTNILVKVKVLLTPIGSGTYDDVNKIKRMEDSIEKHASRKGFTMNIEFVNPDNDPAFRPSADTFSFNVDPNGWPDSGNWSGGDPTLYAHELYHALALPMDRYSYIEVHAKNPSLSVGSRLDLFLRQVRKPEGYDDASYLMGHGGSPSEEEICAVAGVDKDECFKAREALYPVGDDVRFPYAFLLPDIGYANLGGFSGGYAGYKFDFGIPLSREKEWEVFMGLHLTTIKQFEGDERIAYLVGARLGVEKYFNPGGGGLTLGGFGEGGMAAVSGPRSKLFDSGFQSGGYGYAGLDFGYKLSPALWNMSFGFEAGGGATTKIPLSDDVKKYTEDPQMLKFFTLGFRAGMML